MITGVVPNNFQDFKVMLNGFIGNVEGKNAPFRFTADVGKTSKEDSRIQIGDGLFRISAEIGKIMELDEQFRSDDGNFIVDMANAKQAKMFFENTVKYAQSRQMAKEVKKAGRSRYFTDMLRLRVMRQVGFPDRYQNFSEFLDAFTVSYNRNSAIINEANLVYNTRFGISSTRGAVSPLNLTKFKDEKSGKVYARVTLKDLAEPFLMVYGSYSVRRMFKALSSTNASGRAIMMSGNHDRLWKGFENKSGNREIEREFDYFGDSRFWITNKYADYNLRQFANENRLLRGEDTNIGKKLTLKDIRRMTTSDILQDDDVSAQFKMLVAIADKVTGTKSEFNKSVYGKSSTQEAQTRPRGESQDEDDETTVMMMSKLLVELERLSTDGSVSGRKDQQLFIDDVCSTLIESGPDMFLHFGMDSPEAFLKSDIAKKLIEHRNSTEKLGGIRTYMVFDLKMERINNLIDALPDPADNVDAYMDAYNNLSLAIDELAASSEVWHGIIREFQAEATPSQESVFQMMLSGKKPMQKSMDGTEYKWDIDYDASKFWSNPGNHTTLRSVIEDLDMDRSMKWNIIADVVRYWEQDAYLKSWEIGYQLEIGNDSAYTLGSASTKSVMGAYDDFKQSFNRWGKTCQEKLQKDIDNAYAMWGNKPGSLMNALHRLDANPQSLMIIDDMAYADALTSVLDKTYAQTEKSSQHPLTNFIYVALSHQHNGGYMNDVSRTDDRLIGTQSARSIGIQDIVHLLSDPDASITAYDEMGSYSILTRDTIIEDSLGRKPNSADPEGDIWEFLRQNPRVASALRVSQASALADSDGGGYIGAKLSIGETIRVCNGSQNPIDNVKYLMRDHPIYAGIIAIANPTKGTKGRNMSYRYEATEDYLSKQIYLYASRVHEGMASSDAAEAILADLGVTNDAIRDAMRSNYDKFCEEMGLPVINDSDQISGTERSRSDNDADFTYAVMKENLSKYVEQVANSVSLGNPIPRRWKPATSNDISIRGFRGKHSFLSNMYKASVTIDGITYGNAEAAFQAQKCANPEDRKIFTHLDGYEARTLGRKISSGNWNTQEGERPIEMRDDWESIKQDVMRDVLKSKFSNPKLRKRLMDTGDAEIIEVNTWGDREWGVSGYEGQNMLGKMLMDERGTQVHIDELGKPDNLGVDVSSVATFWDLLQELGGAKTFISTRVEGKETYDFATWASRMGVRDRYADLDAIMENGRIRGADQSWSGLWTNVSGESGQPMVLQVSDDGTVVNYDEIAEAAESQGIDEIVISTPESYTVKDRSTDSHGTQVPSLFAYMVSKRSNGAEAFNLKAKKAGLDGKDSIIKMIGKYRQVDDGFGNYRDADFVETQVQLNRIYKQSGIMAAKIELAKMMLKENQDLGYKDLTLANYMCIADVMLIEGADGQAHLRSLEMLFSAIKHRIGPDVDEMSDAEIRQKIDDIVNDVSETGVGMSMVNPMDILDSFRPLSKASPASSIRQESSIFERNYDLLEYITTNAIKQGVEPMSPTKQESVDRQSRMVRGVESFVGRIDAVRDYKIIGYAGIWSAEDRDVVESKRWSVGPSNAFVIGDQKISNAAIEDICNRAYDLGMTVIISGKHRDAIPSYMVKDAIPCSEYGDILIPCFDMRLNGAESDPYNGGRFSVFQAPFSRYVVSVEDSINQYMLGDAQYKATKHLVDRIKIIDNGSETIRAEDLFPNVFRNKAFRNCSFSVSLATGEEVSSLIAHGVRCSIDYGIVEGGRGFKQRKKDVDDAIARYQDRWPEADADGIIRGGMSDCKAGDIVGWACVSIINDYTGEEQYAFAPIIPFQLHGSKKGPETFRVEQLASVDDDNTIFSVDWTNTSEIAGSQAKYFDSSGGANKGMIDFSSTIEEGVRLLDGTMVDAYCAKASTDSRKIGTDRRIKTMISLMALSRMHGYNFSNVEGSFPVDEDHPENKEIREMLPSRRIPTSKWKQWLSGDRKMLFISNDPKLNAFLNYECRKVLANGGNPSDYLANTFTDANGVVRNTHIMWEFEAMFDQGVTYEDSLLHFLHTMDPGLCPDGIEDGGDSYLFALARDKDDGGLAKGFDSGVLQMKVPHAMADGRTFYIRDNVYIGMSFFGEDYTGFSRPNINGASNFLDAMCTLSYYGVELDEPSVKRMVAWASSEIGRGSKGKGSIGKADVRKTTDAWRYHG